MKTVRKAPDVIRAKLSWLRASHTIGWGNARTKPTAVRFLFRPRPWVRQIGACVMRRDGLHAREFATVFVRDSVEKSREAHAGHHVLPALAAYKALLPSLPRALTQQQPLFLQTSSSNALGALREFAASRGLRLSYTENARTQHDLWGTWNSSGPDSGSGDGGMEQGTVAAVNLYIGSLAAVLIAPPASAWTELVRLAMWGMGHEPARTEYFLCCKCTGRDQFRPNQTAEGLRRPYKANLAIIVARQPQPAPRLRGQLEPPAGWLIPDPMLAEACAAVQPVDAPALVQPGAPLQNHSKRARRKG